MVQTASGTTRDRQHKSFVESPSRGEKLTAQEVYVGNSHSDPIPVDPTTRGEPDCVFNEVNILTDTTQTIINKTILAGTIIDLTGVHASGDNIAFYTVLINNVIKYKARSWWSDFNIKIDMNKESLVEGDNIKIIVENRTNRPASFNATLKFNEITL